MSICSFGAMTEATLGTFLELNTNTKMLTVGLGLWKSHWGKVAIGTDITSLTVLMCSGKNLRRNYSGEAPGEGCEEEGHLHCLQAGAHISPNMILLFTIWEFHIMNPDHTHFPVLPGPPPLPESSSGWGQGLKMGEFKSGGGRRNQTWDTSFHFRRDEQRGSTSPAEMQVPVEDVSSSLAREGSETGHGSLENLCSLTDYQPEYLFI